MGRFFGSRVIQNETKDRIYDDNDKIWYIYLGQNGKAYGFVSVYEDVIKNVYATNDEHLHDLFKEVLSDIKVKPSVVTKKYINLYKKSGFVVDENSGYKHFVTIRSDK
jgi:hypothetical protein